ncbi:MAG: CDP-2,3-bis-(O-geranylgeranyl)-sn-glycerol synthase [Candidatus Heimdallarchaeota archaeon]
MPELPQILVDSIVFILPLWVANAAPTLLGGGPPIDGGRLWRDGRRILGDGKTIRGFWMGVLSGTLTGGLVAILVPIFEGVLLQGSTVDTTTFLRLYYLDLWPTSSLYQVLGALQIEDLLSDPLLFGLMASFIMSFGGLAGDIIGSFIKRRSGIERGHTFIFLDQLGFLLMGTIFVYPLIPVPIEWFLVLVPITFITHIAANLFGYFTGIQDAPL